MVFSGLLFLFWFIPIFFIIYYAVPSSWRNCVLFVGSIIFYGWGEPKYLLLIFLSIFVNYISGIFINFYKEHSRERAAKVALWVGLLFDFGMLFLFKYTNFFIDTINWVPGITLPHVNLTLPLGISFYTFQIVSYIVDLYRGKIKCEHSLLNLGTYLVMFPQLIAGPIVVYSQVSEELRNRKVTLDDVEQGIFTFILGLGSKVLLANQVGALWTELENIGYANISMPLAWMGVLAYTLQIYFDFNGYSLMAIGLGRMLGFTIPQNFNYPYISKSLTEFWRRWHMTLSGWFREYVYIPLGGNRRGQKRMYLNLFIVWFATGFWHGAGWNFIFWGLFFFVMLSIEKLGFGKFLEKHPVFARIYSLLLIGLSWMIFAITDLPSLGLYFTRLVSFSADDTLLYYLRNYGLILLIGILFAMPYPGRFLNNNRRKWYTVVATIVILGLSVCYLADAAFNPFLYFRF